MFIWVESDELTNQHFVVLSPRAFDDAGYDETSTKMWAFPNEGLAHTEAQFLANVLRTGGVAVTLH